jgi:hypothetical protein
MKMKLISKVLCIGIVVFLITATVPYITAEVSTDSMTDHGSSAGPRIYNGPKEVYDERSANQEIKARPDKPGKPPVGPQPNPSVNMWAVVIGISDYRGWQYDLQYCDDDARDMYSYLLDKGYPAGNIKLLLDSEANASAIMSAIDWLNSWETGSSEVVFFYSGHGSWCNGYNDGDTEYRDEAIVSADLYLILDGQLRQKFSTFESQKISFIFDSCFSGGMDDLVGAWTGTTIPGRVVVAACDEKQSSYDGTSTQQNGVFTYFYMEGLNAKNTVDTVEGAFAYAAPLAQYFVATQYHARMDPQMYDLYTGDWTF